ncbi:MAG: hypothetical protein RL693_907 [Verrucomicrobiota bacterium]|jgi:DNA-binding transcriptional LysR family regulator
MFEKLFSTAGLSLERLRSFLRVAEAGSITKAADGDPIKQSQFSRQIRELETFFGTELTRRKGKSIELSPNGERLASLIRQEFQALEDFHQQVNAESRSFTLGAGGSILDWHVAQKSALVSKILPDVTWRFESHRSKDLVERVRDGRIDFAIVRRNAVPEGQPMKRLGVLSYIGAVPFTMAKRFGAAEELTLQELSQLPFAIPSTEGQFHEVLAKSFENEDAILRPLAHCQGFQQVWALIQAGACAGVLPSITPRDGFKAFQLPALASYRRDLVLHWNKRQMERRNISPSLLRDIANAMVLPE